MIVEFQPYTSPLAWIRSGAQQAGFTQNTEAYFLLREGRHVSQGTQPQPTVAP